MASGVRVVFGPEAKGTAGQRGEGSQTGPREARMFSRAKPDKSITRTLVGEWRADTSSGEVRGAITATFNTDGTFVTRNQMDVRGVPSDPLTHVGRYRVEPIDRQRFRLF